MDRLTTLVLSGASTNGLVSLGGVQYVWDTLPHGDIVNFVGTSSGSIICALLCVGYTPIEILTRLCTKNAYAHINPDLSTFITEGEGLFSFDAIERILTELLVEKVGRVPTIGQLWNDHGKNFVCVTVNLTTNEKVYLTRETHADVPVTDAVHMSSCFPIVFRPFVWRGESYVDGGVGDNFPVVYSSAFPGRGVCICVSTRASFDGPEHGNVPHVVGYVYALFKIHSNIIARDQDVVEGRECFYLTDARPSFFDFTPSPMKLVEMFYSGYDELEKTCSIYKDGSDSRTREYLKNNHHTLVELSGTQKDKLKKLEIELANREIEGRRVAEKTGIPENIAALDVVKIAMMLGLVKSKTIREGKEPDKTFSILDLFKTHRPKYEKRLVDFKGIPFYFNHSPVRILEEEKLDMVSKKVREECSRMTDSIALVVRSHVEFLNKRLVFECADDRLESFRREAISIINDLVDDLVELDDPEEIDEVLVLMDTVRNHLTGLIPIDSYRRIIKSHVRLMKNLGLAREEISRHLSPIEAFLILFDGFDNRRVRDADGLFLLELQIRCFAKDQCIRPFDPVQAQVEICTPALVFVNAQDAIQYGLIGPYNNNSIGYANNAFYLLKEIKNDVRMWVVDDRLDKTTEWLRRVVSDYIVATFRTVYACIYGDCAFREDLLAGRKYFHVAITNLLFVHSPRLPVFLKHVLQKYSPIVATELDVFNMQRKRRLAADRSDIDGVGVLRMLFDGGDSASMGALLEKYF